MAEPKPSTLGDLVRLGQNLSTWCPSCRRHGTKLRPEDLIPRLGTGMPVPGVARLLRCTRCGRRGGEVTIANRDRNGMGAYRSSICAPCQKSWTSSLAGVARASAAL